MRPFLQITMGDDSKRLEDLIESIADGNAIDWQALDDKARGDDALQRLLRDLRLISGVAAVHRSLAPEADQPLPPRDKADASTRGRDVAADQEVGLVEGGRWGHLRLTRKLGEGTFGEVFHARDTWLDHSVALKLLKPHLANRSRLLHEARTLAQIRHENVVRVHGADVHDERIGFWMEFIQGHTLADVVAREGVRSANEAAVIGQDLCRALAAVHGKNIVHRDIKAKNVMRELGGRIVLMDFGAGEPINRGAARSQLTGTPLYLAPELFEGTFATPQTDIYALGVLLFYLVTGSYPVMGSSIEDLATAHLRGERHRLGDARPDLPDAFVRVVETMLSADVARRYPTAATTRAALEAVVVPASAYSIGHDGSSDQILVQRVDDWSTRLRKAAFIVPAVLVVLIVTGYATSTLYNSPLGLTEGFETETALSWPFWGFRALFSACIVMAALGMAWTLLRILCSGAIALVGPLRRLRDRARLYADSHLSRITSMPVAATALVVLLIQLAVIAAFIWQFQGLLRGLDAFITQNRPSASLSALAPQNELQRILFDVTLYVQVMVFGLSWLRLSRHRSAFTNSDATILIACGIVTTALTFLLGQVVPFRILYHNDAERVFYGAQRCYLVGQRASETRLFCPLQPPPWNRIVRIDDPALKREGVSESIFTVFNRSD